MNLKITSNNNKNYKNNQLTFKSKHDQINQDKEPKNTTNKSSLAFSIGASALSAAVLGGIAFASGKNKIPSQVLSTIKASEEFQNIASSKTKQVIDFAINLQNKVDRICALFQNGGKDSNGRTIGKIIPNTNKEIMAESFLEEYSKTGTLLRRSSFIGDSLVKIEEFTDNGKNILEHNWLEGGITSYIEGYNKLQNGNETFTKKIEFNNDTGEHMGYPNSISCIYNEKLNSNNKNTELEMADGNLNYYFENYNRNTATNEIEIGRGLWFKYGNPDTYVENNIISRNNLESMEKELCFKYGRPVKYTFDSQEIEDGVVKTAESWELQNGTWIKKPDNF